MKDFHPTSSYVIQLVENIRANWMTPLDWQQTAQSFLSPGQYLLWETEYKEQAKKKKIHKFTSQNRGQLTISMIMGTEKCADPKSQISLSKVSLSEISKIAIASW